MYTTIGHWIYRILLDTCLKNIFFWFTYYVRKDNGNSTRNDIISTIFHYICIMISMKNQ